MQPSQGPGTDRASRAADAPRLRHPRRVADQARAEALAQEPAPPCRLPRRQPRRARAPPPADTGISTASTPSPRASRSAPTAASCVGSDLRGVHPRAGQRGRARPPRSSSRPTSSSTSTTTSDASSGIDIAHGHHAGLRRQPVPLHRRVRRRSIALRNLYLEAQKDLGPGRLGCGPARACTAATTSTCSTTGRSTTSTPSAAAHGDRGRPPRAAVHGGINRLLDPFQYQQKDVFAPEGGTATIPVLDRQRYDRQRQGHLSGVGLAGRTGGQGQALRRGRRPCPAASASATTARSRACRPTTACRSAGRSGLWGFARRPEPREPVPALLARARPPSTSSIRPRASTAPRGASPRPQSWCWAPRATSSRPWGGVLLGAYSRRFRDADPNSHDQRRRLGVRRRRPAARGRSPARSRRALDLSCQVRFPRGLNPVELAAMDPAVFQLAPDAGVLAAGARRLRPPAVPRGLPRRLSQPGRALASTRSTTRAASRPWLHFLGAPGRVVVQLAPTGDRAMSQERLPRNHALRPRHRSARGGDCPARALAVPCLAACGGRGIDDLRARPHQDNAGIDWRDQVIYQIMVDRFDDGDPNNDFNVAPGVPGRYHGGDWQGVIDHLDYLQDLGVTALWISPGRQEHRGGRRLRPLPRLLDPRLLRPNPHFGDLLKLRELVDARPRPRHAGDPRRGHEPRGPAVLLRHQRQRPARRLLIRAAAPATPACRSATTPRAPASAAPTSRPTARRARATSSASSSGIPSTTRAASRAGPASALAARPTSASPTGPSTSAPRRPPAGLVRLAGRQAVVRRRRAGTTGAGASTSGGTRATTRASSCASRRPSATSPAGSRTSTPTTPTCRTR